MDRLVQEYHRPEEIAYNNSRARRDHLGEEGEFACVYQLLYKSSCKEAPMSASYIF